MTERKLATIRRISESSQCEGQTQLIYLLKGGE